MKLLKVLLLLLPVFAFADPQPWLKKNVPNELYASVQVDSGCPVSEVEIDDVVSSIFNQSSPRARARRRAIVTAG